jgi:ABC-type microcin C transport system permease subunit YejB
METIQTEVLNWTIPANATDINVSLFTNLDINNASTFAQIPLYPLKLAIGDLWPIYIYFLIVMTVGIKLKDPLAVAFTSFVVAGAFAIVVPDNNISKYIMAMITIVSLAAGAYQAVKR